MTARPENITGVVTYWNGQSGWIKQDAAADKTTAETHDVVVRIEDVASGTIENGAAVSFWIDHGHGIARDVKVLTPTEPAPAPDSPPYIPPPDSPPA